MPHKSRRVSPSTLDFEYLQSDFFSQLSMKIFPIFFFMIYFSPSDFAKLIFFSLIFSFSFFFLLNFLFLLFFASVSTRESHTEYLNVSVVNASVLNDG